MKKLAINFSSKPTLAAVFQKVEVLKEKSAKVEKLSPPKPTLKPKTSPIKPKPKKADTKTKPGSKKVEYPADVEEFFQILKTLNKHNPKVFPLKGPRPSLKKSISKILLS